MELKRLNGLSAGTARQLFTATVVPAVDASNVWMHACKDKLLGPVNRVQTAGAQAIVGTFLRVAANVAEAEANIISVQERHWRREIKLWIDIHTLPDTKSAATCDFQDSELLPIAKIALPPSGMSVEGHPCGRDREHYAISIGALGKRVQTISDVTQASTTAGWSVILAVNSSARNGMVGVGGVSQLPISA